MKLLQSEGIFNFFILLFLFSTGCNNLKNKNQEVDSNCPRIVIDKDLKSLYEKAYLDFFITQCNIIYYKKPQRNSNELLDSTVSIRAIVQCDIHLDTLAISGDTATFKFSYYYKNKCIDPSEWLGYYRCRYQLTYLVSNSKLILESNGHYSNSGTLFDENFRCLLLSNENFKLIKKNEKLINPKVMFLLKREYPDYFINTQNK